MMYNEFIELTGYSESYMTYGHYQQYIEPVYMSLLDVDKTAFCRAFKKAYKDRVNNTVEMLIQAMPLEEKEDYILGNRSVLVDVRAIEARLQMAFLQTLRRRL